MMALANLLEHPTIGPETIRDSGGIKRSNKDLGRVLAIARLSPLESIEKWAAAWLEAMRAVMPDEAEAARGRIGDGLRALLASPADMEQAVETCNNSLLAGQKATAEELAATAARVLGMAVAGVEGLA